MSDYKRLPDGELQVMQALWACEAPATRRDIEAQLGQTMAPTTLLTFLSRLGEKGFLQIGKQGRVSCYSPLVSQKDYLASQSGRFVRQLCGGSMATFANALCDSDLSAEDLEELRQLLQRRLS